MCGQKYPRMGGEQLARGNFQRGTREYAGVVAHFSYRLIIRARQFLSGAYEFLTG